MFSSYCGGSGICLFFLKVMTLRLVCDILVYPTNLEDIRKIWVGLHETVEVWMKFISSRAELEMGKIFFFFCNFNISETRGVFILCYILFFFRKQKKFLLDGFLIYSQDLILSQEMQFWQKEEFHIVIIYIWEHFMFLELYCSH